MDVLLVLKSGGWCTADDVERLVGQIRQQSDVHIACLSDVPVPCERIPLEHGWPGWWSKMEVFRPDLVDDFLYMDLDTIVRGPIDDLFTGRLTCLRDFYRAWGLGSGLMYLPEGARDPIWKQWTADPPRWMSEHEGGGDQAFLERHWLASADRWQDVCPGLVASYKASSPAERQAASVVCFHGDPRPRDVKWRV